MSKIKETNKPPKKKEKNNTGKFLTYKPITTSRGYVKQYDCLLNYPQLDKLDRELYCILLAYAEAYEKKNGKLMTTITSSSLLKRLDCERTTMYRHISKLEELGIIKIEKEGRNKTYHILKDFRKETEEEKEYYNKPKTKESVKEINDETEENFDF